jgi:hypothetical protein
VKEPVKKREVVLGIDRLSAIKISLFQVRLLFYEDFASVLENKDENLSLKEMFERREFFREDRV